MRLPPSATLFPYTTLFRSQRYVWTTGSWLVYEYLEQATPEERTRMEKAVAAGDIAWHALPFTWQTRSEEHTSELQSQFHLVCRLLLEKKNNTSLPPRSVKH